LPDDEDEVLSEVLSEVQRIAKAIVGVQPIDPTVTKDHVFLPRQMGMAKLHDHLPPEFTILFVSEDGGKMHYHPPAEHAVDFVIRTEPFPFKVRIDCGEKRALEGDALWIATQGKGGGWTVQYEITTTHSIFAPTPKIKSNFAVYSFENDVTATLFKMFKQD
jgi:hypothetical protein